MSPSESDSGTQSERQEEPDRKDREDQKDRKGRESALELEGVKKSFQQEKLTIEALKGVSFKTQKGRITGLIGPDGAGKTTLMRICVGLLLPDAGSISVMGKDVVADPLSVQSAVGYMPQRFGLYEDLSVQENLDLYADLQGVPKSERKERYEELMGMTRLGEFTDRLAGRLSGGMKQKLGLACTLVRSPEFLILDEPTVGVDPVSRRELWSIVSRLVEKEGMSVLLSTAYLDEAERCHEVVMLHEGEVLGHGHPADFSRKEEGNAYRVTAQGMKNREIQSRLARGEGVVDAVISGDGVRLVMAADHEPDGEKLLPDAEDVEIASIPPRFEDRYVSILKAEKQKEEKEGEPQSGEASEPGDHENYPEKKDQKKRRSREEPGDGDEAEIRVEGLNRKFGDFYAVKDVSFDVKAGEIFGLLGANGAGKTTTFRMLCGLLPPSGGTLSVAGVDLRSSAAEARALIGYMSQKFSLYGSLSVLQNLRFFSSAYNLKGKERKERIDWALDQFDLRERAEADSGEMPLGYKQRLALACALMHKPEILFLDEPTSGVDPMARREFWNRINALSRAGVTVLVTTHFMEEAEYCDRLAIMVTGEILALGTPHEIREQASEKSGQEVTDMEEAFIALIEEKDDGE